MLCDDPEGWDVGCMGGRPKKEGIYMCVYITDSFLPTAETNVTLYNNHTPKKKLPPRKD